LRSPVDFKPSAIAVLFVVLIAVASIPVITHALPPLSDYLNHLGRTYVINHAGSDPDLSRYYFTKWQVLPNLMIDAAMLALNPFMDIYRAGQVFTIAAFVLILSGALALNRALFGYWSALPLAATPLLYNGVLLVGVMNYVFGIGLALWAFAAWVALREKSWPWRFSVSTLFAVTLFFCHLYAVGFYGLVLLAFELRRLWEQRAEPLKPRVIDFIATGIPFLLVMALLWMSPTLNSVGEYYWTANGKIDGLFMAVDVYYSAVAFGLMTVALATRSPGLCRDAHRCAGDACHRNTARVGQACADDGGVFSISRVDRAWRPGVGRSWRSFWWRGRQRLRACPRAFACHHRALGAGEHDIYGKWQTSPAGAGQFQKVCRDRRPHAAVNSLFSAGGTPRRSLFFHPVAGALRLCLHPLHQARREPGSCGFKAGVRRAKFSALSSHQTELMQTAQCERSDSKRAIVARNSGMSIPPRADVTSTSGKAAGRLASAVRVVAAQAASSSGEIASALVNTI
jgi:hypothetical protein